MAHALDTVLSVHARLNATASRGIADPTVTAGLLPPLGSSMLALPEPTAPGSATLAQTLAGRRSSYAFGVAQPPLGILSALLHGALGAQRVVRLPDGSEHEMGRAPSAGGLPSIQAYVVARGPGEVPTGVHRVEVRGVEERGERPRLDGVRLGDPTAFLAHALDQPELATRATLLVVLVARLDTTLVKYPARHYRTLHVDAGVALQNLSLVATALGLPCCAVMGYDDAAFAALLDLPETSFATVLLATGSAPADPARDGAG